MTPEPPTHADTPPAPTAEPSVGVLGALPRTRPQRASARRASARAKAKSETATPTRAKAKPKAKTTATATKKKPAKRQPSRPVEERAPKQGYEPEEEIELGNTVHPPSGGELIESLTDIVGELVGAGTGAGGRLLKDALSIFRRP